MITKNWFENKHHLKYNWVGYVAALVAIGGLIAQIETIYSRKSAGDISYIHLGARLIILLMWLVYGWLNKIPPTIFSGITGLILTTIILGFKIHYGSKKKKDETEKVTNKTTTKEWGPKVWYVMHLFSYKYPENPSNEEKNSAKEFYKSNISLLPCENCKKSALEYIENNPVTVNNKNDLINWVLNFHNFVNKKLNKVEWNRKELDAKFN